MPGAALWLGVSLLLQAAERVPPTGGAEGVQLREPPGLALPLLLGVRDVEGDPDGEGVPVAEADMEPLAEGETLTLRVAATVKDGVGVAAAERVIEGAIQTSEALKSAPPPCATARNSAWGAPAGSGSAPSGANTPASSAAATHGARPEEGVTRKKLASAPSPQWPLPSRSVNVARAGPNMAPRDAPTGAPTSSSCASVRPPEGSERST